ncbi:hypothetical protein DH2020_009579 [Rehmannia glutinosa]|uniref:Protein kinase domain-containing protein n=1 Tax=Rehmannia glutinosa TaxID=99300 RepID=A0ABR0X6Q9_REHGL
MITNNHIFPSLISLVLLLNAIHAVNTGPNALVLNCGSSNSVKDADGRTWDPDAKYLSVGGNSTTAKAETQDPSLPSDVPYMSARIFLSETTYQFPLQNSTSRTLLRLHFYPSSYPNLNISNSYFSVVAGGVTLLNNFSASLAAEALSQAYFIKEYYMPPSEFTILNVTLKPSDKQPQSFAFLNGIEVISTPTLFDEDPILAGSAGGLMRRYDDSLYIYGAGQGVALQANTTINYKGLPSYMAPIDVYGSYRSMGAFVDVNRISNLTWIFQVDPNFMYLLRFHWCDSEMTKTNQRVFDVFINNKTAASEVDLFAWTQSTATPTKKDYVVQINNNKTNNNTEAQLWVALHPTDKTFLNFLDVLLNGLEIFKLSDKSKKKRVVPPISTDAACNCRYFNLSEIKNATKNFDESNVIGVGGFGKVYKGVIDGNTKVAIKRSNPSSEQGVNEFQTEIEMLSRLRHRHLVSLIGFCEDNGEMILVYDYMGQGTLREHLYKGNKITLSWKQRLEICIGAARGLHYLHTGAKYTIIHRDVKTTNILLDDKWVAKVSDFGLSKTGPNMNQGHVKDVVVLCARPALNPSLPKEQVSLADWALRCARNKTIEDNIDPQLKGKISSECLKKFSDICERQGVDFENIDQEKIDHNSLIAMHRSTLSLIDDDHETTNAQAKDDDNADDVFSQIEKISQQATVSLPLTVAAVDWISHQFAALPPPLALFEMAHSCVSSSSLRFNSSSLSLSSTNPLSSPSSSKNVSSFQPLPSRKLKKSSLRSSSVRAMYAPEFYAPESSSRHGEHSYANRLSIQIIGSNGVLLAF